MGRIPADYDINFTSWESKPCSLGNLAACLFFNLHKLRKFYKFQNLRMESLNYRLKRLKILIILAIMMLIAAIAFLMDTLF